MESSQKIPVGLRTYRFSLGGWAWSIVQGAIFAVIGCLLLMQGYDNTRGDPLFYWAAGAGCCLVAAYFPIRAAYSAVIFDQESVTVRGVFFTQSIRRRSVSGYVVDRGGRYQAAATRLISNSPGEMNLDVPKLYAFDDVWRQWMSSLPDLDRQQKEEEEARFTLK